MADDGAVISAAPAFSGKRIAHSVRALAAARATQDVLNLYFHTAFDLFAPQGVALWHAGTDGVCQQIAQAGTELCLPGQYTDWCELNNEAILTDRVVTIPLVQESGSFVHVAAPSVIPSRSYLVLHLLVPAGRWNSDTGNSEFIAIHAELLQLSLAGRSSTARSGGISALSDRQRSILERMAQGQTYRTIADALGYSESTIKQEALKIFEHLSVSDRHAAVAALRTAQPSL